MLQRVRDELMWGGLSCLRGFCAVFARFLRGFCAVFARFLRGAVWRKKEFIARFWG